MPLILAFKGCLDYLVNLIVSIIIALFYLLLLFKGGIVVIHAVNSIP